MQVTYGKGFEVASDNMAGKVQHLENELRKLPQYEPLTKHTFHAGMYCRDLLDGGGSWHNEYHAGVRYRAHTGNRYTHGLGCQTSRHLAPIFR